MQAQDRFFEMDFRRHVTAGPAVRAGRRDATRSRPTRSCARWAGAGSPSRSCRCSRPDTQRYLQAYADGVNAYLDRPLARRRWRWSTPCSACSGLDYQSSRGRRSTRWPGSRRWPGTCTATSTTRSTGPSWPRSIPEPRIDELYPPYPYGEHAPICRPAATGRRRPLRAGRRRTAAPAARRGRRSAPAQRRAAARRDRGAGRGAARCSVSGDGIGSNSWVVVRRPHHDRQAAAGQRPAPRRRRCPGIWYQMGLHCRDARPACPFDVAGFTFSGLPGVVIGHNDQIAWGFTNLGRRRHRPLPRAGRSATRYERRRQLRAAGDARTRRSRSPGAKDVTITVRTHAARAARSPTSRRRSSDAGRGRAGRRRAATRRRLRRRAGVDRADPGPHGRRDLRARHGRTTGTEFRAAARFRRAGAEPGLRRRRRQHRLPGARAGSRSGESGDDGADPAGGRAGLSAVRLDRLRPVRRSCRSVLNPPEGFVVTANQAVDRPELPVLLTDGLGLRLPRPADPRPARSGGAKVSRRATCARSSCDTAQRRSRRRWCRTCCKIDLRTDPFTREAQRLLRGWDFTQPARSRRPRPYYNAVWRNLLRLTFDDELAGDLRADGGDRWFAVVRQPARRTRTTRWWDDTGTAGRHRDPRRDPARGDGRRPRRADPSLGKDPDEWQWGQLHRLDAAHRRSAAAACRASCAWLFNRGPWYARRRQRRWSTRPAGTAYDGYAVDCGAVDADGRRPRPTWTARPGST